MCVGKDTGKDLTLINDGITIYDKFKCLRNLIGKRSKYDEHTGTIMEKQATRSFHSLIYNKSIKKSIYEY